jgi:hypothetical protein
MLNGQHQPRHLLCYPSHRTNHLSPTLFPLALGAGHEAARPRPFIILLLPHLGPGRRHFLLFGPLLNLACFSPTLPAIPSNLRSSSGHLTVSPSSWLFSPLSTSCRGDFSVLICFVFLLGFNTDILGMGMEEVEMEMEDDGAMEMELGEPTWS